MMPTIRVMSVDYPANQILATLLCHDRNIQFPIMAPLPDRVYYQDKLTLIIHSNHYYRNKSTIKDEEALYQNLKNLVNIYDNKTEGQYNPDGTFAFLTGSILNILTSL